MNSNEIQRLAHAISNHRPDWMIASLRTFIERNMSNWAYRDASVALTWIATDAKPDGTPASATPKRVLENGPWRIAAAVGGAATVSAGAPKRHEECQTHAGRFAHNCGLCRVENFGTDEPTTPLQGDPRELARAAVRAAQTKTATEDKA